MIGKIASIANDFLKGGVLVTLSLKQCSVQELQMLSVFDELQIDMKKYRAPRSKDANAYFHVLVGKIADALDPPLSKAYVKNILISRYGQPEIVDGEPVHIKTEIPPNKMNEQESLHCSMIGYKEENGKDLYFYKVYRPSHTLNSKEFSILLNGTVEEAKDLGIETMSAREVERLLNAWQP